MAVMEEERNDTNFSANTQEQLNSRDLVCIREEFLVVNAGEYVSFNPEQKPHSCHKCSKKFVTKKNLITHLRKHIEEEALTAAYFEKISSGKHLLGDNTQEYISLDPELRPDSSDHDSETFTTETNLAARLLEQEQPDSSDCFEDDPPRTDDTQERVSSNAGRKKRHSCDQCSEMFTSKDHLAAHLREHKAAKPCYYCERGFRKKSLLLQHLKSHSGEKPISCDQCGKRFVKSSSLTCHMRIHTGEKPYSCELCSSTFRTKGTLTKHQRVHQRPKRFSCGDCGRSFGFKTRLDLHFPCKPVGSKDTNQDQNENLEDGQALVETTVDKE